jgi:hypothetical protein
MHLQFADDLQALSEIVEQLRMCKYECEGGHLENNVEFIRLEEIAARWEPAQQPAQPDAPPA